jgi:hypothetical protein
VGPGAFRDVLAEKLRSVAAAAAAQPVFARWPIDDPGVRFAATWVNAPRGAGFTAPHWRASRAAVDADSGRAGASFLAQGAPQTARAARVPSRALSPRAHQALAILQRLGAIHLTSDFSAHDLRKAFRDLALRYHPDRHPRAAPEDQARLAASFAEATDAYRVLISVLRFVR